MKNIKLLNKIAPVGIDVFDKTKYNVSDDVDAPEGIMVRSAEYAKCRVRSWSLKRSHVPVPE